MINTKRRFLIKLNASLQAYTILQNYFCAMKFFAACFLLICTPALHAQEITGIWRGYFTSGVGFYKQQYNYELQIDQKKNKGLRGVTYSYRSTLFYGKANLHGIFMDKNKSLIIKEDTLVEVKIADKSEPCLMTCYLDYYTMNGTEVLEGTFTSTNAGTKTDCGSGTVYLERVIESDFHKEDFLLKKEKKKTPDAENSKPPVTKKNVPGNLIPATPPKTVNAKKPAHPSSKPLVQKKPVVPDSAEALTHVTPVVPDTVPSIKTDISKKIIPVPKIIQERENSLVRKIITNSPDIKIELYDNGEIDGDTITVYHNNELVAFKRMLTDKPITINIKASTEDALHEFVMVADNLGRVPPNTALMVLTTGGKRYELFISSNEQKNAKVIIEYVPAIPKIK